MIVSHSYPRVCPGKLQARHRGYTVPEIKLTIVDALQITSITKTPCGNGFTIIIQYLGTSTEQPQGGQTGISRKDLLTSTKAAIDVFDSYVPMKKRARLGTSLDTRLGSPRNDRKPWTIAEIVRFLPSEAARHCHLTDNQVSIIACCLEHLGLKFNMTEAEINAIMNE